MINLAGKQVLVTRPDPQGQALCDLIDAHGGVGIHFPTIVFGPAPDAQLFAQQLTLLPHQDWLIFTSAQAVAAVATEYAAIIASPRVKVAAIGEATKTALHKAGIAVAICPTDLPNSENLLALPPFQTVQHQQIAVVRGVGGREQIDPTLAARGARVTSVIAYERCLPTVSVQERQRMLTCLPKLYAIVCTSFNSVENLCTLLGADTWSTLQAIPLLVMSERIKKLGKDLGFQTIWVANANHARHSDYNLTLIAALV